VAAVGWLYRDNPFYKEEPWMNFYTQQHKHYCGIDLHAKALYVWILDQTGTILVHKNLPITPGAFLRVIAPSREDVVGGTLRPHPEYQQSIQSAGDRQEADVQSEP
jgi:hypothetical protein